MKTFFNSLLFPILLLPLAGSWAQNTRQSPAAGRDQTGMIQIPAGELQPFLLAANPQPQRIRVRPFLLDEHAVTNAGFLEFVKANPEWRRSRVSRVFADKNYLKHWAGDENIGDKKISNSPVTNISWFAANAYCRWKGKRLPTLDEWEYAADALPINAKPGENLSRIILAWYDHPAPVNLPNIRSTYKNRFGVWDMHGLIWEWVDDFNSILLQGQTFYCGGGAAGTASKEDYAAYMRYAFRESLKATYTVGSLGFRCAEDLPVSSQMSCCSKDNINAPVTMKTPALQTSIYQLPGIWTDQHNHRLPLTRLQGRIQVMAMIYTHCTYACPRIVQDMKAIQSTLSAAKRKDVGFVLISFDTRRDDPARLRRFAAQQGLDDRWTLLHGDAAQIRELSMLLNIKYQDVGNNTYSHSDAILILDRQGTIIKTLEGLQPQTGLAASVIDQSSP